MDPADIRVVRDVAQFREFLDWMEGRRGRYVALDTETSEAEKLHRPDFRVRLIQVGDTQTGWVFPWHMWGSAVGSVLHQYDGRILIHNADFDMTVLALQGIHLDWARVVDTMLAMRIAEPDERAGLKESANRHLDPLANLTQRDLKDAMARNKWTFDTVPLDLPIFLQYAGWDVVLTSRLYELPVVQEALASPVWQLEMDTAKACATMALRGMTVDVDECATRRDSLRERAQELRRVMLDIGLDVGSPVACRTWFAESSAGDLLTKRTAGGAYSVDRDVLDKIIANVPGTQPAEVARTIIEVRTSEKLASAYFGKFIDLADHSGRVHAQIMTSEAKTGRMSIRDPALQTLPKEDTWGVRKVVLPRNPGEVLLTADYDQIEMRLAAVLSRDAALMDTFRKADETGGDFFTLMGQQIYHDPSMVKADPRRHKIKSTMYGMLYGAGAVKIAVTAKISANEARAAMNQIFATYPGLRTLMTRVERQARRDGYITTMGGRRLTVPSELAYKGLNAQIQGSAAVLFKRALVNLACAGLEEFLVVPVHDEIVFSVPRDIVPDVSQVIRDVMPIRDLPLMIGADPSEELERWGDQKK